MPQKLETKHPSQAVKNDGLDPELVRRRAYEMYVERGMENGHDVEDWLRAEEELLSKDEKPVAAAA